MLKFEVKLLFSAIGCHQVSLCFQIQQEEHEDGMFYEEEDMFGEEQEGWSCLEW